MMEFVGWIGAILFSLCAVPQAIYVYRTHNVDGLSRLFLQMWLWGEIFTLVYVLHNNIITGNFQWPLYANYLFNIGIVLYIIYAKYRYGK